MLKASSLRRRTTQTRSTSEPPRTQRPKALSRCPVADPAETSARTAPRATQGGDSAQTPSLSALFPAIAPENASRRHPLLTAYHLVKDVGGTPRDGAELLCGRGGFRTSRAQLLGTQQLHSLVVTPMRVHAKVILEALIDVVADLASPRTLCILDMHAFQSIRAGGKFGITRCKAKPRHCNETDAHKRGEAREHIHRGHSSS